MFSMELFSIIKETSALAGTLVSFFDFLFLLKSSAPDRAALTTRAKRGEINYFLVFGRTHRTVPLCLR